jgi:hypothetical protein
MSQSSSELKHKNRRDSTSCHVFVQQTRQNTDLLVIQVTPKGLVLPPLVFLASSVPSSPEFHNLIREEHARMPKNTEVEFIYERIDSKLSFCFLKLRQCFKIGPCDGIYTLYTEKYTRSAFLYRYRLCPQIECQGLGSVPEF